MPHNVDFHAVTGPGGGAAITSVAQGETKTARFKLLNPGLYTYHCAAPPVPDHIANGMYGLILVEPEKGLPKVDREYYVMQSEFYTKGEFGDEGLQEYSPEKGAAEKPTYVVFNGKVGSLQGANALKANVGDKVRVYFGNIGPNLISSFHIIGTIFDQVYREGSLSDPTHNVQTTVVPAGSAAVVELKTPVPGNFTLVDHSIFRIQKGALGTLTVTGAAAPDIYSAVEQK
jgi:nitrite reductase (NO-forming)